MPPKLTGVLETALYVDDVERAAEFYQRVFGFERIAGDLRLVALSVLGRHVLLLLKKGGSIQPHRSAGGVIPGSDSSGTSHLTFAIAAAELEAWEKWLAENEVGIESKVSWELGGHSLYFRDPDQHLLELATPGTWLIY